MSLGIWYWLILVLTILFGGFSLYKAEPATRVAGIGSSIVLWVLLFIIGMAVFGGPVSGGK